MKTNWFMEIFGYYRCRVCNKWTQLSINFEDICSMGCAKKDRWFIKDQILKKIKLLEDIVKERIFNKEFEKNMTKKEQYIHKELLNELKKLGDFK